MAFLRLKQLPLYLKRCSNFTMRIVYASVPAIGIAFRDFAEVQLCHDRCEACLLRDAHLGQPSQWLRLVFTLLVEYVLVWGVVCI
jgi:hypothetical protein